MDHEGAPHPRKRCYELIPLSGIFLAAIVAALAGARDDDWGYYLAGCLGACLVGLHLRVGAAWWASLIAAVVASIAMAAAEIDTIQHYGLRYHPSFARIWALGALSIAAAGLLLGARLRRAFVPRARPVILAPAKRGERPPIRLHDSRPPSFQILALGAFVFWTVVALSSMSVVMLAATRRYAAERYVAMSLRTVAAAETDFRQNDRDENRQNDFWIGDVQGLYGLVPPQGKEPLKLIEWSVALADSNPLRDAYPPLGAPASAKAGAWFWALPVERTDPVFPYVSPDAARYRDPSRFGFIAYPDDCVVGLQKAFIVNEGNTIFEQPVTRDVRPGPGRPPGPLTARGLTSWPPEAELQSVWRRHE